jgi:hypothetical protein
LTSLVVTAVTSSWCGCPSFVPFPTTTVAAMTLSSSSTSSSNIGPAAASRLVYGKDDMLFGCIEEQQGTIPFGNVLDAGTGMHSLRWIATLGGSDKKGMTSFTAITADATMQQKVQTEAKALGVDHLGSVLIGNWFGTENTTNNNNNNNNNHPRIVIPGAASSSIESQLELESYDVVLADYLIGAMDGFSPHRQEEMIPKLVSYLKPGGRLYIVGLEPIPDSAPGDANLICQVRRIRDACILLAGHRCYREYPMEWIQRQILQLLQQKNQNDESGRDKEGATKDKKDDNAAPVADCSTSSSSSSSSSSPSLYLLSSQTFSILYRHESIVTQINVGRSKLPLFPNQDLAKQMKLVLDDLERQSLEAIQRQSNGRIRLGFDYVVAAEKRTATTPNKSL